MPKNNLSKLLENARNNGVDDGMEIGMQFAFDLAVVSLHDKYGFGAKRITEFITEFQRNYSVYKNVFRVKEAECDVLRYKFDEKLKEAFDGAEDLPPEAVTDGLRYRAADFNTRYPLIKEIKY